MVRGLRGRSEGGVAVSDERWYQGRSAANWAWGVMLLLRWILCAVVAPAYVVWAIYMLVTGRLR